MLIAMVANDTEQNGRSWMTKETLLSLARTVDWNKHRLIVIDNASCEATLRLYEEMEQVLPFRVFYNDENLGTAKAINAGWRHRQLGEHCVKMDNDCVIHQAGWADWIEDVFSRSPEIGICGLKRKDLEECLWSDKPEYKSELRMLPHDRGQRWLVVEKVYHVIGTCLGFSSTLLDKIGGLTQPGLYGFDDSSAAVRAKVAGFQSVFLCGFEIDHLDPGDDTPYTNWKLRESRRLFPLVNSDVVLYEAGLKDIYHEI